ncbi:MAG TPA: DUF4097 family beta strand repeat-containing protein [Thermoanaerobaculia bacterium]|nr:DUF4097 family beta strand repeat-containing protein [Thermoanaerobaculia bacterium]
MPRALPFPIVLSLLLVVPPAAGESSFSETHRAAARGTVTIHNPDGAVVVRGWTRDQVSVAGVIEDERHTFLRFEVTGDEAEVAIEGEELSFMQRVFLGDGPSAARLEVWVPRGSRVTVNSRSAHIGVAGVTGALTLASSHGVVEVTGAPARVVASTVSGAIRFAGRTEDLTARSVSGSVEAEGVGRRLVAATVSGSIRGAGENLQQVEMQSVSGALEFAGSVRAGGRLEAQTTSGDVDLVLPPDLEAAYRLSTARGRIENGFGPPPRREDAGLGLRFGRLGARVSASTGSGELALLAPPEGHAARQ